MKTSNQGFALVTVLIMGVVLTALLAAYFSTTLTEVKTTRATADSASGFYAAEAGLNLRAEEIRQKFQGYSRPSATDLVEKSYALSNGRTVATSASQMAAAGADVYTVISNPDDNFNGLASLNNVYNVSSVAKSSAGDTEAQLDMQITSREIPVFQFLGFHQENMEFHPGPSMTIHGRVHSNKSLYLASNTSSNTLSIDGQVSAVTDIRQGYTDGCGSGPVRIMSQNGTYKQFGTPGTCKRMSENDLAPFGGLVKYLDQPLAVPPPESFEWKIASGATVPGFYWNRAELRIVLNQGRYVDLFAAAGRAGDKPRFVVPAAGNGNGNNGNGNGNGNNGNGNGNCGNGNGNGNGNGCNNAVVTIWAPEVQVYHIGGAVDTIATRNLYSLMIDNPGMITVNLPRNGRTDNGRPNSNSTESPANDGANNAANLTNKYLSTSYATANSDPLNWVIPPYCQTFTDLPRPYNANASANDLAHNHQDVRLKGYLYPNNALIDTFSINNLNPEQTYAFFTNPSNPNNLSNVCKYVVARGEFYHHRQNREMLLLNVNVRQLLEANRDAAPAARLFNPGVSAPNGGLVVYLSVDGARHTPAMNATSNRDKGNNYGVRLFDAADLSMTNGVTFVSDQAVYIQGDFNCRAFANPADLAGLPRDQTNTGNLNDSGNPVSSLQPPPRRCHQVVSDASGNSLRDADIVNNGLKRGVAVIADSVNILSDAWKDQNSRAALDGRRPSMTQQNVAVVAGSSKDGEGGLHNFPRFLESWEYVGGGVRYRYRGSLVAFRFPVRADGAFERSSGGCCGLNYRPPLRDWDFDLDFRDAAQLPPLTPRAVSIKQDLFLREFEQQ